MIRTRAATALVALASTLVLAGVAVLTGAAHDGDDEPIRKPGEAGGGDPAGVVGLPEGLIGLELALGLKDPGATRWDGTVQVSEGRVRSVEVVRSAQDAEVEGAGFRVGVPKAQAKKKKAAAKKKADQPAAKKKAQQAAAGGALLHIVLDAPPAATVSIETDRGWIEARLADLKPGARALYLDGEAGLTRQDAAVRLTGPATEDDFPALASGPDGSIWLAYVAYLPERARLQGEVLPKDFDRTLIPSKHGDRIRLRRFDGRAWQAPIDVTGPGLDVWRPAVAVEKGGAVWVVWAQQVKENWDLYARRLDPKANAWGEVCRLTDDPGSDFHVVAASDPKSDRIVLAWQAWRDGQYDIVLGELGEHGRLATPPKAISESRANDWGPALAIDPAGRPIVAYDTYDKGQYDVRLYVGGPEPKTIAAADSPRFEARPSLALDAAGRPWVAYEEGDEQWGKDYANGTPERVPVKNRGFALYINRTIRVKCFADGKLVEPAAEVERILAELGGRNRSVPRLAFDGAGGLWLFLRHHPLPNGQGEAWVESATRFDGKGWSPLRTLPITANLLDNRPALAKLDKGLLAVWSSDKRANTQGRGQDDLYSARLAADETAAGAPELVAARPARPTSKPDAHPDEKADIARMRAHRVEVGGRSLRLIRGEFHRHTELSAHRDGDGLLEDSWRYALDAADLDWMGNGDHLNGAGHEYMWWYVQKMADLHHNAPRFVPAQTYERSAVYPNGHRNVMLPRRGVRPLPFGDLQGTAEQGTPDTKVLYAYLKHFGGICASHTSATNMGTDWRDNDPEVEPVVEIYQGHRHNYEHPGAPRAPTADTQIGGFQPTGFIWNALDKGYKLGFQSSSDHISTHLSYAVVLAPENSRRAIIDAFKARHCYAATDNILLDVRSGDHLMGDSFEAAGPPTIEVAAHGTAPIARLHVIRDNKYALTTEPKAARATFRYTDDAARRGESHLYYIRIEQADGNLAWSSPMWITLKP